MSHSFSLISTLAIGFAIAWALGFLMERIKVPALVGYLLAGIIISPATPGFVGDVNIASELSEIGVMLLMFGVGLHFSMSDLIRVKNIAVPGAILQMGLATCLGAVLAHFWGWPWGQSIVFGMCLSCASTVVLLKGLESRGILESGDGQIAVGWLVVEDIMTVLILVLLPPLASLLGSPLQNTEASLPLWQIVGITLAQVFGFIILMLVVGKRLLPWLLRQVAKTGSRELFTLSVLVFAIGIAYGAAQIFHVSFALGAFFSGMVMRESRYSHRAAMESLPLRDAFAVIFFVGVGMMFDPKVLYEQPLHVLAVLAIIILGKGLVAFGLVLLFRYTLHTALTVAAALAQIGEFSFILAALGLQLKILPQEGMSLVLAGAIISIALNPFAFATIGPARDSLRNAGLLPEEWMHELIRCLSCRTVSAVTFSMAMLSWWGTERRARLFLMSFCKDTFLSWSWTITMRWLKNCGKRRSTPFTATRPIRRFSFKLISTKRLFSFLPSITRSSAARLWKRPRSFVRRLKRSCLLKMRKTLKL